MGSDARRQCTRCREQLSLDAFSWRSIKGRPMRPLARCKECIRAEANRRRAANPEPRRLSDRAFKARHPERKRAERRRWKLAHPEANRAQTRKAAAKRRKEKPEEVRAEKRVRRALMKGCEAEKFYDFDIFERDQWKCGICTKKVDKRLAYPHPLSASIDHVIPLTQGDPHRPENVRLAHLICNIRRGNRGGGEQLRLVS